MLDEIINYKVDKMVIAYRDRMLKLLRETITFPPHRGIVIQLWFILSSID